MFLLEDGRLYTPLANAYPGACAPYTQTRILALSVPTRKCVFRQIWVKLAKFDASLLIMTSNLHWGVIKQQQMMQYIHTCVQTYIYI